MGSENVKDVLTISEEALALFALEDKYEYWYRSFFTVCKDFPIPNPHPRVVLRRTAGEQVILDWVGNDDVDDDDDEGENDSDDDDDEDDGGDDDKEIGTRSKTKPGTRVSESAVRGNGNSKKNKERREKKNNAERKAKKRKDLELKEKEESEEIGLVPNYTSGKPEPWPQAAIDRYNYWCRFLVIHRKGEMCGEMQVAMGVGKTRERYLGLKVKKCRGKRSLMEMTMGEEGEGGNNVGSIFKDDGSTGGIVGTVYSKYNAQLVDSSVVSL